MKFSLKLATGTSLFIAALAVCTLAGIAPAQSTRPEIIKPRGIFSSAGSTEDAIVNDARVHGVLVRVMWTQIEPRAGNFDFSMIERQIALARAAHKQWSLAVVAGPHSPEWIYGDPYNVEALNISFRGSAVKVPKFWNPGLQKRLEILAAALAKQYGDDPSLALVYLPQMSANGVEGHFNGNPNPMLTNQGFTEDLWVAAVMQSAKTFASAFKQKPIAVELHYIMGSASAGKRIMKAIEDDPALLNQIGVAMWWLSGRTDYQGDLTDAFGKFKGDIYAQLIDRASRTDSFPSGDYTQAFAQAKKLGIRYVEPWDVDVKSHQWDQLFDDFDKYAKGK